MIAHTQPFQGFAAPVKAAAPRRKVYDRRKLILCAAVQTVNAMPNPANRPLLGIALASSAWAAFSLQDVITKTLVVAMPVPEALFGRGVLIVILAGLAAKRGDLAPLRAGANLRAIGLRTLLTFAAWLAYYAASRQLQLTEMVTFYFAAPLFVVALARPILGETIGAGRWAAAIIGFAGVLVAANPSAPRDFAPVGLVLFAAFLWATTTMLARSMTRHIPTTAMMVGQNIGFLVICGASAPSLFIWPDLRQFALLVALGLCGGAGQFLWFEGMRLAEASLLAPFEYTMLAWSLLWGWIAFGDWPGRTTLLGAGIILVSGLVMLSVERRRHIASALVETPGNV